MLLCYPLIGTLHWNAELPIVMYMVAKSFLDPQHTQQMLFMMLLGWQSVRSSVESVAYPPSLELGTCCVGIHHAICSSTAASTPLLGTQVLGYEFCTATRLCKWPGMCGTVYGGMYYEDLLGPIAKVGNCIPIPNFYPVLHDIRCRKGTLIIH